MKFFSLILSIFLILLTSACARDVTSTDSPNELAEPFRVALDELISTDTALNANMEYISLVLNEGISLENSEKQGIEEYLQKKYKVKIYNYSYEQLMEKKLYKKDENMLKGILLTIEKQKQPDNKNEMTIEISKYRSNEGAIALEMILVYQEGQWKVAEYSQIRQS
ncbi:hypothetical protein [Paenibacillus sp. FSL R10-2736]|uniref:hypothetical protein n=1 Tax=Paenibacillus sp. FSL R10-2736 TaxID=2954692 RepID=UPI0030FC5E7A